MKAKLQITFHSGGNWTVPLNQQQTSDEIIDFDVSIGDEIEGKFLGNKFTITDITSDEIKFTSEKAIAKNNENGTINLRETNKDFVLKINEEQKLHPAVTDMSSNWIVKLISIGDALENGNPSNESGKIKEEDIDLASKVLKISVEIARENSKILDDCNAVRIWNPIRGGGSIIIANDGTYLAVGSLINPEKHLEEFKNGRRTTPNNGETEKSNKAEFDCFCGNKIEMDMSKIPATEKTLYVRCPKCNSERKWGNPNYKAETVSNEVNKSEDYDNIINNVMSKLTGNNEEDIKYLNEESKKYTNHPLAREIAKEIGRKIFELLPEDEKKGFNSAIKQDIKGINKLIDEAHNLVFSKTPDLNEAKNKLNEFIKQSDGVYKEDEFTRYCSFRSLLEFMLYTGKNSEKLKTENKKIIWVSLEYSRCYNLLAYIYNEEKNFEEALKMVDKAIYYNPMDDNSYFERAETFKLQQDWEKMREATLEIYDIIYDHKSLAHYFRNLGYYYIETKKLDIAWALYFLSLQFFQSDSAYHELEYIDKLLGRDKPEPMPYEDAKKLLEPLGIIMNMNKENLGLLMRIFDDEKFNDISSKSRIGETLYAITKDVQFLKYSKQEAEKPITAKVEDIYDLDKIKISDNDNKRTEKNVNYLKEQNIPYYEKMINIPRDFDTNLITKEECWSKLMSSFAISTLSASILNDQNNAKELIDNIMTTLIEKHNIESLLNMGDKSLINSLKSGNYSVDLLQKLSWNYEQTAIFMWALGLIDKPSSINQCDVDYMNDLLYFTSDPKSVFEKCSMRSKDEVLDYADLIYRYKWACEEARIKGFPLSKLNELIVQQQQLAVRQLLKWDDKHLMKNNDSNTSSKMNEYILENKGLPAFKITLPPFFKELIVKENNTFEFPNKSVGSSTRFLFFKCDSESGLFDRAEKWMKMSANNNKQEITLTEKEMVGDKEIIKFIVEKGNVKRLYKMIYKDGCMIVASLNYKENSSIDLDNTTINKVLFSAIAIKDEQKIKRDDIFSKPNEEKKNDEKTNSSALSETTSSKIVDNKFTLKDIVYDVTGANLSARKLNNEFILSPEVTAITKDENVDYEMSSVNLYHNNGFNTHITTFEELKGKKFVWEETYNDNNEEAGCLYVQEHEDVTKGVIEILDIKDDTITIKWSGLANVYWNDDYSTDVPFETTFITKLPKQYVHIIDATKSPKVVIDDNTQLELTNLSDFDAYLKQISETKQWQDFNSILKFKLTYNNEEYLGEVIFKDGKLNYTTNFDEKCPKKVIFKGFDFNIKDKYEEFRFEIN